MTGEISSNEFREIKNPMAENYKNIKPEGKMSNQEINDFWKNEFSGETKRDQTESNTEKMPKEYIDDKGVKYREGDKLQPDTQYEVNGYRYQTDDMGRIVSAEGKLRLCDSNYSRSMEAVREKEGQEYRADDEQGHLIGHQFGGSDKLENLVPMNYDLNRKDYKKLESSLATAVQDGADVRMKVEPVYEGASARPSEFRVTYSIDGERDIVVFKNESEGKS